MRRLGADQTVVSANQVLDKTLFAKTRINVRSYPTTKGEVILTVNAGDRIGKVYSWVKGTDNTGKEDGSVWWMYYDKFNGKTGYTKHDASWYDFKSLKQQGVKTVEDQVKEKDEKDKSWFDKLTESFKGVGTKILVTGAVVYVAVQLGKAYISKPERSTSTK